MKKVFILTNNKQLIGAKLARYAIERNLTDPSIGVEIVNVDDLDVFKRFIGRSFRRKGNSRREETWVYDPKDLQSFTLARIMPPELMGYEGKAVAIDPDIFALSDISELFAFNMQEKAIACCRKSTGAWETSVLLLDCSKLRHWSIEETLLRLERGEIDYHAVMRLEHEDSITPLPWQWNSFDKIEDDTKILHTTRRLTQPWRAGLPLDYKRAKMPRIFGLIPREPIHRLFGKKPNRHQPHPDKRVEEFFFSLLKDALAAGAVSHEELTEERDRGNIRADIFEII